MFDQWQNDITANTSEADEDIRKIHISRGVITKITIDFPYGCENLARCRLRVGNRPLVPRRNKGYVHGNGVQIDTGEIREPTQGQNPTLYWHCWNVDETHNHELTLSATWRAKMPEDELLTETKTLVSYMKRVFTRIVGREV